MTSPRLAPEEPVFHAAYLRHLCNTLRHFGADSGLVLAQAGMTERSLEGTPMLPLSAVRWLILAAQHAVPRPTLALESGARLPLDAHAVLGAALRSCPTLRSALEVLVRFMPLRTGVFQPVLEAGPGGARYVMQARLALGDVTRFACEHILGSNCSLLRKLFGPATNGIELELPWPRPPWHAAYEALAGPVRYDSDRLALRLPDRLLALPNPAHDAATHARALSACERSLVPGPSAPMVERVFVQMRGPVEQAFSLASVARALGVSPRTVERHLRGAGLSFQQLIDDEGVSSFSVQ